MVPGLIPLLCFHLIEEAAEGKRSRKGEEQFPIKEGFSLQFLKKKRERRENI